MFYSASIDALKLYIRTANQKYDGIIKWFTPINEPGGADSLKIQAVNSMSTAFLQISNQWAKSPDPEPARLVFNVIGEGELPLFNNMMSTLRDQWHTSQVPAVDWHVYHAYTSGTYYYKCGGRCGNQKMDSELLYIDTCTFINDWANYSAKVAFPGYDIFVSEYSLSNCRDDNKQCTSKTNACDSNQDDCNNKDSEFLTKYWMAFQGGLNIFDYTGSFFWSLHVGNGYDPRTNKTSVDFSDLTNLPWSLLHLAKATNNQ